MSLRTPHLGDAMVLIGDAMALPRRSMILGPATRSADLVASCARTSDLLTPSRRSTRCSERHAARTLSPGGSREATTSWIRVARDRPARRRTDATRAACTALLVARLGSPGDADRWPCRCR